jgi:hypothetical protein
MAPGQRHGSTGTASDPAVIATAGLLHRRRGWIWMLAVSAVGSIAAVAVITLTATTGTAYVLLTLTALLMLLVFVISLTMVFVDTARLRGQAPGARGPALAAHRTARRPVLAHPHDRHRHPVSYAVGWIMLLGWLVGAAVLLPRLVDSAAYLAGAGGHATFMPTSYLQQCAPRTGCSFLTNGMLTAGGHETSATWPDQVPLNVPFTVREPVWRWALGSGLINGTGTAIGSLFVCLIFDAVAVLAVYIAIKPWLGRTRRRRRRPPPSRPRGLASRP